MPIDYDYKPSEGLPQTDSASPNNISRANSASLNSLEQPTNPGPTLPKIENPPLPTDACFSTTLQQLDQIELLNRNQDQFNQVPVQQNFPDPLKGNQFMATVPDQGILTQKPIKPPVVYSDLKYTPDQFKGVDENTRLKILNDQANRQEPTKSGTSLADFIKGIAQAYLDIINDLLDARSLDDLHDIFLKDNRLLSVGILFIAVAVFFLFFSGKTDGLSSDKLSDIIHL